MAQGGARCLLWAVLGFRLGPSRRFLALPSLGLCSVLALSFWFVFALPLFCLCFAFGLPLFCHRFAFALPLLSKRGASLSYIFREFKDACKYKCKNKQMKSCSRAKANETILTMGAAAAGVP
jgi:hypothetical protein